MSGGGGGGQPGSSGGQSQTEETAIHTPLREMGFDANLISEGNFQKKKDCIFIAILLHSYCISALRTLNLNGNEVSAQAINQCATWMIDHQSHQPSTSGSSNGWSLNPIR